MKLGLIWSGLVLLGGFLATGEVTSGSISAAIAVALVVWVVKKDSQ